MDSILVLDFGGQYSQLIARRVRDLNIYSEIRSFDSVTPREIAAEGFKGVILTGGPASVNEDSSPKYDPALLDAGVPLLGICYGAQLLAYMGGGTVATLGDGTEYGRTELTASDSVLFDGVPRTSICWMSHRDSVSVLPEGFETVASTKSCLNAAFACPEKRIYGLQFHPEVTHSEYGIQIMDNFLTSVCGCSHEWKMDSFADESVTRWRSELEGKNVLLGLSGGVDSSVAAVLLQRAIGDRLTCVFVDHGLLRKNEKERVEAYFRDKVGINLVTVSAQDRFLEALKGVTDPEQKRKIIGEQFIRTFEEYASSGDYNVLAQGTIYPDVIESGKGHSAVIKSHHNVGGLPSRMKFESIAEPLRDLFKDEVRRLGTTLGLPEALVYRQPFPGPGLGVRVLGEITEEKLNILRDADAIFCDEVESMPSDIKRPSQYFAVLTDSRSVGVKGDAREYSWAVALRAVMTDDFMTADWVKLPYEVLDRASVRITNEVPNVSRIVYDITAKPPATVEWE